MAGIELAKQEDLKDLATKAEVNIKTTDADLHKVAKSGAYTDLTGQPEIPSVTGLATKAELKGYTKATDLNIYAKTTDLSGLATKAETEAIETLTNKLQDRIKALEEALEADPDPVD